MKGQDPYLLVTFPPSEDTERTDENQSLSRCPKLGKKTSETDGWRPTCLYKEKVTTSNYELLPCNGMGLAWMHANKFCVESASCARGIDQSVKCSVCKPEDLGSIPRTYGKCSQTWWHVLEAPASGRHRQEEPWALLARQSSLVGEY